MRWALTHHLLAFVAGLLAAEHGVLRPAWALVLGLSALAAGPGCRRGRSGCWLVATLAAGALALGWRFEEASRDRPAAPLEAVVEGRVVASSRAGDERRLALDRVVRVGPGPSLPRRLLLYLPVAAPGARAVPGDRLRAALRLRAPGGVRNPGRRDRARALARAGIGAVARPVHPRLVAVEAAPGLGARARRVRRAAARRLEALGPGGALLAALALGERGGLYTEARRNAAALGLGHLLAVSGLHLALVAGAVYTATRWLALRSPAVAERVDVRPASAALALALAAGYALAAGWGVPVRRALVFLAAAVSGAALRRPHPRHQPLVLAALVVLVASPAALFDAGAQLSFAATAALVLAAGRVEPGRRSALGPLVEGLRASAAAIAATGPLAALQFGGASPVALLANAVAVPLCGLVLLPLSLLTTAVVVADPSAPWSEALARAAAALADAAVDAVSTAARHLPGRATGPAPAPAWVGLSLLVGVPAVLGRRTRVRLVAAAASGLALALAPPARIAPGLPRAVFLDVGQGDATLVQGRAGTLLVDAGTAFGDLDRGRDVVLPALAALGVDRIDLLAVTHADLDHRGGAPAVLDALPVGEVWLPRGALRDPAFDLLRAAARRRGVAVRARARGDPPVRVGDLEVAALGPVEVSLGAAQSRNRGSLVLRVAVAGRVLILAGDAEAAAEADLLAEPGPLRADVLKLGHHGSRTSSTPAFLDAVSPALAVASAPCHGRFGMPHAEVVTRVRERGAALWWTGRDGAVLVALGSRLWVRGWGPPRCRLGS